MREYLAFALLACACGAAAREPARGQATPGKASPAASSSARGAGPLGPDAADAFESLEARWAAAVPGMRPLARREAGLERVELARAESHDLCVRVAFEASDPVVASLHGGDGTVLATSTEQAGGLVPDQGPVCVRKGDTIQASARGPSTARVRWVAWSGP